MRWTSSGSRVRLRMDSMTGGPIVGLGTKWPSITSTWSRSAPPASTRAMASPSAAKSAERMLGAILIMPPPYSTRRYARKLPTIPGGRGLRGRQAAPGRGEGRALFLREAPQVLLRAAPLDLGIPAEDAQVGAGRVNEHAVAALLPVPGECLPRAGVTLDDGHP